MGPFSLLAIFLVAGILIDHVVELTPRAWLMSSLPFMIAGAFCMLSRRPRGAGASLLIAASMLIAGWSGLLARYVTADDVRAYLAEESQLVRVVGTVDSEPRLTTPTRGALGRFAYHPPGTLAMLRLEGIYDGDARSSVTGVVLLKISQAEYRLRQGDRIEALGWLARIEGPSNPGEFDYAKHLADRGVYARLTLKTREQWARLDAAGPVSWWSRAPGALNAAMAESLHLGLSPSPPARVALLDALLLGRWRPELEELGEAFRHTGLMHLLSISGAHLSILLGLVWLVARAMSGRPRVASLAVVLVLAVYLLAIPPQVPLTRAGIMAGVFALAYATGRRATGIEALSLSAVLILLWRPADLFNPGAQLSYLGVAALLLWTKPVGQWLWADPVVFGEDRGRFHRLMRWGADYLAVNFVASAVLTPLAAYHFGVVSPLCAGLSMLALPVVTVILGVGFFKLLLSSLFPSLGWLLARPLEWSTDALIGLVDRGSHLPGAWFELKEPPSLVWVLLATAIVPAMAVGVFKKRRVLLAGLMITLVIWPVGSALGWWSYWTTSSAPRAAVVITMFDVGDGSCFLVRAPRAAGGEETLMFDCGSQQYMDVGVRSIVPALRALGVSRVDTLAISHADIDHFCGALDLAMRVPMGRVVMPGRALDEANSGHAPAMAALLQGLSERGIPVERVEAGWSTKLGDAEVRSLWPPPGLVTPTNNDTSLVLAIRAGGRRVLFSGDAQQRALDALLVSRMDLRSDIAELPHHGSMVAASAAWFEAVRPSVVLQSTGAARMRHDAWRAMIPTGVTRHVTLRDGMSQVTVHADGTIATESFKAKLHGTAR